MPVQVLEARRNQDPATQRQFSRRLFAGLLLGGSALCFSRPVDAAPRLVVSVYPDQGAGSASRDGAAVPGSCDCDGRFDAADARLGQAMPVGALTVRLVNAAGREMARRSTTAQPNGRQSADFDLPAGADWRAQLLDLPSGWLPCVNTLQVAAQAIDQGEQRLEIGLRPSCAPAEAQRPAGLPSPQGHSSEFSAQTADQPRSVKALHQQVTGQVFVDRDLDGLSDADEVGLAGVRVTLAEGRRTHRTRTAPSGRFAFRGNLAVGYVVQVEPPTGYRVTTTDRFQQVPQTAALGTAIGFGLIAVERGSAGAVAPKASSPAVPPAARGSASPPRHPDSVRFVAAWPSPHSAATISSSIGMTGSEPQVGAGLHLSSSIRKDHSTCAS